MAVPLEVWIERADESFGPAEGRVAFDAVHAHVGAVVPRGSSPRLCAAGPDGTFERGPAHVSLVGGQHFASWVLEPDVLLASRKWRLRVVVGAEVAAEGEIETLDRDRGAALVRPLAPAFELTAFDGLSGGPGEVLAEDARELHVSWEVEHGTLPAQLLEKLEPEVLFRDPHGVDRVVPARVLATGATGARLTATLDAPAGLTAGSWLVIVRVGNRSRAGGRLELRGWETVARHVRVEGVVAAALSMDGDRAELERVPASATVEISLGAVIETARLREIPAEGLAPWFELVHSTGARIEFPATATAEGPESARIVGSRTFTPGEVAAGAWTLLLKLRGAIVARRPVWLASPDEVAADLDLLGIRVATLGVGDPYARVVRVDRHAKVSVHVAVAPRKFVFARNAFVGGVVRIHDRRGNAPTVVPFVLSPKERRFENRDLMILPLPKRSGDYELEVVVGGRCIFTESFQLVSAKEILRAARIERAELVALEPGRTWVVGEGLAATELAAKLVAVARLDMGALPVGNGGLPLRISVTDELGAEVFDASGTVAATGSRIDVYAPAIPLAEVVARVGAAVEIKLTICEHIVLERRITLERPLSFTGEGAIVGQIPERADEAAVAAALAFFAPERRKLRKKRAPRAG